MLAALGACRREGPPADGGSALLGEVKSALAEREKRLHAFHLVGEVREAGRSAPFETFFRAPNRVRGELPEAGRTIAFDGAKLFELDRGAKTLTAYDARDRQAAAVALHDVLGVFVPEGYRVPVIDLSRAAVKRGAHPRGPEAVTLTSEAVDEAGQRIEIAYVLRWPGADLLEKRMSAYGTTATTSVDAEHCDERLKVCVPRTLTQRREDVVGAVTHLETIELGASAPVASFTLAPPDGYTERAAALGPSP